MSSEQFTDSDYLNHTRANSPLLTVLTILVIILVVAAIVGTAVLIRQYQATKAQLDELEVRFTQSERLLTQRLDDLQAQTDLHQEALAGLEERFMALESSQADLADEQNQVIDDVAALQEDLPDLSRRLATIENDLQAIETIKDTLQANVDILRGELESASSLIGEFGISAESISKEIAGISERWEQLKADVQLLEAMQLLTRGQILLEQGETSQAETEIQNAQDLLVGLSGKVSEYQEAGLDEITKRLDDVLERINLSPISAAEILDGIWKRLLSSIQD